MNECFNMDLILERAMKAFECKTQKQLAEIFGISAENFSAKKKRGTLIKLIEKEAFRRNKSYDWIKTGQGEIHKSQANLVAEPSAAYHSIPASEENFELINKTSQILNSNTIFRSALRSNIDAFHHALYCEEEIKRLNNRVEILEDKMKSMNARLPVVNGS